jgi:hypothetical protein
MTFPFEKGDQGRFECAVVRLAWKTNELDCDTISWEGAMLKTFITVVLLVYSGVADTFAAEALKKVRIASKAAGESLVPYVIPQRLGFYREEGMDVDVIVTRGTVTTQVVVSGAVDYSNGGSTRRSSAARG